MITQHELKEILSYNSSTGEFFWINWRSNSGQKLAGTLSEFGYRRIKIKGKTYRAARLAYLYMTGDWPVNEVDHINQVPSDDRWCNLRDVTASQNCSNKGIRKDNKSGFKGVYSKDGKFGASFRGRHLGTFSRVGNAALAYNLAAIMCAGDFAGINV